MGVKCGNQLRVVLLVTKRDPMRPLLKSFFFNDTATTEIYTLSLHDALPIYGTEMARAATQAFVRLTSEKALLAGAMTTNAASKIGRHTSELQSPVPTSYAVFCLKKKKIYIT